MARGRMLNQSYAKDKLLAELIDQVGPMAGLICFGFIPFQDRDGRIHGDPRVLKGQCWPRVDSITPDVIEAAIRACHEKQLLIWYEVDGDRWICFPNFAKNQEGFRYDRESESTIPPPPQEFIDNWRRPRELVLANSGVTPAVAGITPQNSAELRKLPAEVEVQDQVEVEVQENRSEENTVELPLDGTVSAQPSLALGIREQHTSEPHRHKRWLDVQTVWTRYRTHHPQAPPQLKSKRKEHKAIVAMLEDFSVEQLCKAIDGYHRSPFHQGVNAQGTKYLGLELIMRDIDHVNKGIAFADDPNLDKGLSEKTRKTVHALSSWAGRQT